MKTYITYCLAGAFLLMASCTDSTTTKAPKKSDFPSMEEIERHLLSEEIEQSEAYLKGRQQKLEESVKGLREAAEQGDAEAQVMLAETYSNEFGIQNAKEAVKWARKAAEQGNAEAQFGLGVAYSYGEGVAQDYDEAAKWFRKAADQEHMLAQFNLALCYGRGEGVAENHEEGVKWLRKAAAQGHDDATDLLKALGE